MKTALDQNELTAAIEKLEGERATLETNLRTLGRVAPAMPGFKADDLIEHFETLESHVAALRVTASLATPRTSAKSPAVQLTATQRALAAIGAPVDSAVSFGGIHFGQPSGRQNVAGQLAQKRAELAAKLQQIDPAKLPASTRAELARLGFRV